MLDALCREREREREKEKERKKGGETKTEEAPLLRVLRVVRVDTNVFDEKIVECIFVCYYYIRGFLVVLWRSAFDVPLLLFLEQTFNDGKEWCFVYHGFVIFPLQRPRLSVRVHSFRLLPRLRVDQRRRSRVVRPRDDRTG